MRDTLIAGQALATIATTITIPTPIPINDSPRHDQRRMESHQHNVLMLGVERKFCAGGDAEGAAANADEHRFGQDEAQQLRARHADGAQDAELPAA